jgi:hypothetical protein
VIFWKDFVFDEIFGPLLVVSEQEETGSLSIRNDAIAIQETRQEQRPARMVGTLRHSTDTSKSTLVGDTGMEAAQAFRFSNSLQRGKS